MPVPSRRDRGRPYAAYFGLLLLFAIAVAYHARTATAVLGTLLDSNEHVHEPFELDGQKMGLFLVRPEARAAGIKDGDLLTTIQGQPVRGVTDFYSIVRQARPGQRLQIQVASSTPGVAATKNVSIEFEQAFPNGPRASDWLSFALESLSIPILCFALGFWVVTVRIHDKLAWLLLVVLLSFPEMFGAGGYPELNGRADLLQPVFVTYHMLFANVFAAALLLFALYFPEQLSLDRRFPWAKWLVVGPLLLWIVTIAITFSLYLHHAARAHELRRVLGFVDKLSQLHVVAIVLFFGVLAYKTFNTSDRDARRRLLLVDLASGISVTPIVLWLFFFRHHFTTPEWGILLMAALWFLFPLPWPT